MHVRKSKQSSTLALTQIRNEHTQHNIEPILCFACTLIHTLHKFELFKNTENLKYKTGSLKIRIEKKNIKSVFSVRLSDTHNENLITKCRLEKLLFAYQFSAF